MISPLNRWSIKGKTASQQFSLIFGHPNGNLTPVTQAQILQNIVDRSKKVLTSGMPVLAVFDLDSTLFDVSPRIQKIIHDFADHSPELATDPATKDLLKAARTINTDWGMRGALERAGLNHTDNTTLTDAIRKFWKEKFFSSEYLKYDTPFEGAIDYVNTLFNLGVEIVYLTGREEVKMKPGTLEGLRLHGFPYDPPRASLAMRPSHQTEDELFKNDWFIKAPKHRFEVIWFFENEPLNIDAIRKSHPEVETVFVDSTHSGKATKPVDLPVIFDFKY